MAVGIVAAALAGALIAVGPTGPVPATPAARDAFDRGRTAFGRAEYQRAIEVLHPLLYPEVLLDSEGEVVQARRMLGVAYLFENKPDEARREFRKLLELRPDYRFDPLLDPQRVVDFFNGVLKEEAGDHRRDGEAAPRARQEARGRARSATPRGCACRRPSSATNGTRSRSTSSRSAPDSSRTAQRRKGWLFFGAEAVLGAVSVGRVRDQPRALRPGAAAQVPRRRSRWASRARRRSIDHSQEDTSQHAARRPGRQRRAVLRRRDLGRHRRHPSPPARGAVTGRRQGRARAPARRASHVFAQRPRRLLGVLKGNR